DGEGSSLRPWEALSLGSDSSRGKEQQGGLVCHLPLIKDREPMRYAICNETFEGWDHARVCRFVAGLGYTGLEVAPFTLAPRVTDLAGDRRTTLRRQAEECGLTIIGLHWLLARTEGLHVTSPDADVRRRTADYLAELARCCRDLGGSLMVFGSPAQRSLPAGSGRGEALAHAA